MPVTSKLDRMYIVEVRVSDSCAKIRSSVALHSADGDAHVPALVEWLANRRQ